MPNLLRLAIAVLVPLLIGFLGSLATMDGVRNWYPTIAKPSFTPPSWVFGPVWTLLYLMMGIASWLVWRAGPDRPEVRSALVLYGVQLAFNLAWSWLFFGLRQPGLALVEILVLLVLILWTVARFGPISNGAAWLLAPYAVWVSFASVLNAGLWWLNR